MPDPSHELFEKSVKTTELGAWGESLTAEFLKEKGYRILARNYRCRFGEIDLIAERKGVLAFVEVKLRKNNDYGAPREFVTSAKQRKIRLTASFWLAGHSFASRLQPRFDVAEVIAPHGPQGKVKLEYLENAFT